MKDILEARGTSEAVFKKHYKLSHPATTAARSNEVYGKRKSFEVKPVKVEEESVTEEEEEEEEKKEVVAIEEDEDEEKEEKKEVVSIEEDEEQESPPSPVYHYPLMMSERAVFTLLDACQGFGVNHDGPAPKKAKVI